jgi:hypothetical protein
MTDFILHVIGEVKPNEAYAWRHGTKEAAEEAAKELCERNRSIEVMVASVVSTVACRVTVEQIT